MWHNFSNCSNHPAAIGEIGSTPFHSVNDLQLVEVDCILVENLVLSILLQIGSKVLNDFDGLKKSLKGETGVMGRDLT